MPQPSVTKICLKITCLKFHSNFLRGQWVKPLICTKLYTTVASLAQYKTLVTQSLEIPQSCTIFFSYLYNAFVFILPYWWHQWVVYLLAALIFKHHKCEYLYRFVLFFSRFLNTMGTYYHPRRRAIRQLSSSQWLRYIISPHAYRNFLAFLHLQSFCNEPESRALSQHKDCLLRNRIPIMKIRWSYDSIIYIMGIPILVRCHLYIETAPMSLHM